MTKVPADYARWLSSLGFSEISIGSGGLRLEPEKGLPELQVGYSVAPDGMNLCTGEEGAWQENWLVIGYDTSVGDPVILDTSAPISLLTAMHGAGSWDPVCIATSLDGFDLALKEVQRLAFNRENPVSLGSNPIPPSELALALAKIEAANPSVDILFWKLKLQDFE